ncbi:MAG: hypothetical protein QXK88_05280 [Desulfurococcaceae archaeon]
MEKILEIPPRSKKFLDKVIENVKGLYESLFVPCAPGGIPMIDCFAAGAYISSRYNYGIFSSIRTYDCALNHVLEKAKTALDFGFRGILITKGDPPQYGKGLKESSTESAISFIREAGLNINLGIVISLRFQLEDIRRRLRNLQPDFAFIMRYHQGQCDEQKFKEVVREARDIGTKTYVFILLGTEKNILVFNKLKQPYIHLNEFGNTVKWLNSVIDGVVVSSPLDFESAIHSAKELIA